MTELISGIFGILLIAILISTLFYYAFNVKGPWGSFWTFFVVILLSIWIASLWVDPLGPIYYGIAWITLSATGLLVALLLTAISRPGKRRRIMIKERKEAHPDPEVDKQYQDFSRTSATISGIFWLFMVIMMFVVVLGYVV